MSLLDFVKEQFHPRVVNVQTGTTYTITATDEQVTFTGSSAATWTLPDLTSFGLTTRKDGVYLLQNNGTAVLTITPATGQTIINKSNLVLNPGDWTLLRGNAMLPLSWKADYPNPIANDMYLVATLFGTTNGTTAVTILNNAQEAGYIVGVLVWALDTTAGNITVVNASNTVATIAKGTTAGVATGEASLANQSIAIGNSVTIASSSAGNARVCVFVATQPMSQNG